jgi:hypothetical protein
MLPTACGVKKFTSTSDHDRPIGKKELVCSVPSSPGSSDNAENLLKLLPTITRDRTGQRGVESQHGVLWIFGPTPPAIRDPVYLSITAIWCGRPLALAMSQSSTSRTFPEVLCRLLDMDFRDFFFQKLSEKGLNGAMTYAPEHEKELPYRSYRCRVEAY